MPQLAQRLRFDLPDALARDREALADLLERVLAAVADAEPHLDHLLLTRRERLEHRLGLLLEVEVDHRFGRRHHLPILDEVAEMRIFLLADRRFEGDRLLRDLQHFANLGYRNVHALRDLFRGRLAAELLHQRARRTNQLVDRLDHVHGDADRPRLIRNRAGDGLADPPRRVGRELVAAPVLELVDGLHQPDVALLDQIQELQTAVRVLLGDRHDEPQVRLDQFLLGLLRLPFAAADGVERLLELVGLLLEAVGHPLDLEAQIFDLALDVLLVFFLQLELAVLRTELAVVGLDLALHDADALDRLFHVVDEAALDRLGEFDAANELRQLHLRPHLGPQRAPILPLLSRRRPLRRFGELLFEFLVRGARLADGVDLLLHLARPLGDALVGNLLVVEDHQLQDGALAGVQLIAELDHFLGDERRARDRLYYRQLPALDPPRDLDLALARQERHRAHLAQVHADRIVGLVERARREIELELLGAFARPVDRLVVPEVFLVRVDDLDAGAAERVEEVVELVRGGDLRRQQLVDFVVEQVALLFADVDQLSNFVVLLLDRQVIATYVSSSMRCSRSFFRCHKLSISSPCCGAPSCWSRSISR